MEVSIVAREPARRDALAARVRLAGWRIREAVPDDNDRADDSDRPTDLVLIDGDDIRGGRVNGLRLAERVVIVSSHDTGLVDLVDAWPVHGWALVTPDADAAALASAAAAAADGFGVAPAHGRAIGRRTSAAIGQRASSVPEVRVASTRDDGGPIVDALTPRERAVLALMADGLSNREIAARLGVTPHTAKFHVASILGKLGVSTRAAAVRRGLRRGWVAL